VLLELPLTQIAAFARLHSRPRSVPRDVAETLLGDRGMRARLICDDERCCPHGINSPRCRTAPGDCTKSPRKPRPPPASPNAARSCCAPKGLDTQLPATAQDALARVAEFLRHQDSDQLSA